MKGINFSENQKEIKMIWLSFGWVKGKKVSLPKICHTYSTIIKLHTATFYLKKIQNRNRNHMALLVSILWAFKSFLNKHGCNFDHVTSFLKKGIFEILVMTS